MAEILGIDLSKWNEIPENEFDRLTAGGCQFGGVRLSVGRSPDARAQRHLKRMTLRGWITWGYHYLNEPEGNIFDDGVAQAETYLRRLGELGGTVQAKIDGHVLDVEEKGNKWGQVVAYVERLRRAGLRVGLYSTQGHMAQWSEREPFPFDWYWWADHRGGRDLALRLLSDWETKPGAERYRPPTPSVWQFGGTGSGDTATGLKWTGKDSDGNRKTYRIDGNVWDGTAQQLLDYVTG